MQGYEAIKELKQLLDEGLITQEDFDQKKTELLNAASADAAEAPIDSTLRKLPFKQPNRRRRASGSRVSPQSFWAAMASTSSISGIRLRGRSCWR